MFIVNSHQGREVSARPKWTDITETHKNCLGNGFRLTSSEFWSPFQLQTITPWTVKWAVLKGCLLTKQGTHKTFYNLRPTLYREEPD